MTRGRHIILLFIITSLSSFLFMHSSSAQASSFLWKQFKEASKRFFNKDNVPDIDGFIEKYGPDKSNNLPPDVVNTIAMYQKAWNLTVTGKMDAATKSFFNCSRCGVAAYSKELSLVVPWPEDKKELTYICVLQYQ